MVREYLMIQYYRGFDSLGLDAYCFILTFICTSYSALMKRGSFQAYRPEYMFTEDLRQLIFTTLSDPKATMS
jgi:hypothetical protein